MTGKRREGRRNVKRGSVSHGGRHPRRGARPGRYAAVEGTLLAPVPSPVVANELLWKYVGA